MASTNTTDWRDHFCGRAEPLARLEQVYQDVSSGNGPRAVVVLGDRGMGKTRLVQELYRILTTRYDPDNYWPDAALFRGNNLRVAPEPNDPHFAAFKLDERRLPFLWWGLRLADPLARNAAPRSLTDHRAGLTPHLGPVFYSRQLAAMKQEISQKRIEAGQSVALKAVEAIPLVGPFVAGAFEALQHGRDELHHRKGEKKLAAERANAKVAALASREGKINEVILDDLKAILKPDGEESRTAVPLVLFVDDAQFACSGADDGTFRFLRDLWYRAQGQHWPVLLLATHWAADWDLHQQKKPESFAAHFARLFPLHQAGWEPLELHREDALVELIDAGLPNLPRPDRQRLLDKADGNPQLLIELIALVRRSPAWRTPDGALTEAARRELVNRELDIHRLILERLEGDVTPPEVRAAVALSSVQGMELLCALTEAAGRALNLPGMREGLDQAREPHRYLAGTSGSDLASFVQRAYREAAQSILPRQIKKPEDVKTTLLEATLALIDDETRWSAREPSEQRAGLGVLAGLGEDAADPAHRQRAADAMLTLIEGALNEEKARDYARAAELARRFEAGLDDGRWLADGFSFHRLEFARKALAVWHGTGAGGKIAAAMLLQAERADRRESAPDARGNLALAYSNLGGIAHSRGELEQAEARFRQALEIQEPLARELNTPEARGNLAETYYNLGDMASIRGELEQAEARFRQALDILKPLSRDLSAPGAHDNLATTYHRLGDIARIRGDLEQAEAFYRRTLDIEEPRARELKLLDAREVVSGTYSKLGEIADTRGDLEQTEAYLRQALEINESLARELNTPEARRGLGVTFLNLGYIARKRGELEQAEARFRQALEIDESLARELNTPKARCGLAVTFRNLGHIAFSRGELEEAEACYRQALDIQEPLACELNTPYELGILAAIFSDLGEIAHTRGELEDAEARFRQALDIEEPLARELNTPYARRNVAVTYSWLGIIEQTRGALEQAEGRFIQALELLRGRAQQVGTLDSQTDYTRTRLLLARLRATHEPPDDALALLQEVVKDSRAQYLNEHSGIRQRDTLIEALARLLWLHDGLEAKEKTDLCDELAELIDSLNPADQTPKQALLHTLAIAALVHGCGDSNPNSAHQLLVARQQLESVAHQLAPTDVAEADLFLTLAEIATSSADTRKALEALDSLQARLRTRLGDQWEKLGGQFRQQIDRQRNRLAA